MDLMAVKRSRTLLKEIESPTDDFVNRGNLLCDAVR